MISSKKIIISGANGFIGECLVRKLSSSNKIFAWSRKKKHEIKNVSYIYFDIRSKKLISEQITSINPDIFIHLAGQSSPRLSWDYPIETIETNLLSTIHILETLKTNKKCRVLICGSSAEYASEVDGTILEISKLFGTSPYGVSKNASSQIGKLYYKQFNMDIIIFRPFFIIGENKQNDLCSDITKRVIQIDENNNKLEIGDIEIERDFLYVNDAVNAIIHICHSGTSGEVYNICSGSTYKIIDIIEILKKLSKKEFFLKINEKYIRKNDQKIRMGSNNKLKKLGWKQKTGFEESIEKIYKYLKENDNC